MRSASSEAGRTAAKRGALGELGERGGRSSFTPNTSATMAAAAIGQIIQRDTPDDLERSASIDNTHCRSSVGAHSHPHARLTAVFSPGSAISGMGSLLMRVNLWVKQMKLP